jgi:hypothetical protein
MFAPRLYRNCSLMSISCDGMSVALTGKPQRKSDEFSERFITGDESWIYDYNIELKSKSRVWIHKESPGPEKSHGKANKTSKSCGWLFLTAMELCTTNSHLVFETISSLNTTPYPAPYCIHINTLINANHFLTTDFTLPSTLLYSHQHTDHHKPFPHCTLHLTQRLTVLTSTH